MINKTYADFAWEQASRLLAIDSPSGFTAKAAAWVKDAFEQLGEAVGDRLPVLVEDHQAVIQAQVILSTLLDDGVHRHIRKARSQMVGGIVAAHAVLDDAIVAAGQPEVTFVVHHGAVEGGGVGFFAELAQLAMNLTRFAKTSLAADFVKDHHGEWNHRDWLEFCAYLEDQGYTPIDLDQVGLLLEKNKAEYFNGNL